MTVELFYKLATQPALVKTNQFVGTAVLLDIPAPHVHTLSMNNALQKPKTSIMKPKRAVRIKILGVALVPMLPPCLLPPTLPLANGNCPLPTRITDMSLMGNTCSTIFTQIVGFSIACIHPINNNNPLNNKGTLVLVLHHRVQP